MATSATLATRIANELWTDEAAFAYHLAGGELGDYDQKLHELWKVNACWQAMTTQLIIYKTGTGCYGTNPVATWLRDFICDHSTRHLADEVCAEIRDVAQLDWAHYFINWAAMLIAASMGGREDIVETILACKVSKWNLRYALDKLLSDDLTVEICRNKQTKAVPCDVRKCIDLLKAAVAAF